MAQTIKIKRSATSGNKLTGSNSVAGEIGMNTADKSLYIQTGSTDSSVVTIYDDSILHLDDTNNRVGIGTTSPAYKLDVNGTFRASGNGYFDGSNINFSTAGANIKFNGGGGYISTTTAHALRLQTNNTEALRLTSGQNAVFAGTISSGNITAGNSSTSASIRAHYNDGSYMTLEGFGLEMNRGASYIRPTTDGDKTLYFGMTDDSRDWASIRFRSTAGLYLSGSQFIDASRNLTNIGTISSGAITSSTGTVGTSPNTFKIVTSTEANTAQGDVYAALEFHVTGAENSTGTLSDSAISAIKAIDYRSGTTSFEDAGLGFYTVASTDSAPVFRGGFANAGGLFLSVDGNVDRNTGAGDLYADSNIEAANNLTFNNQFKKGSNVIINNSSELLINTVNITDGDFVVLDNNNTGEINIIWRDHSADRLYLGTDTDVVEFRGNVNFQSGNTLSHNGNVVLDASRNLTNIGTISSGAITATGAVTISESLAASTPLSIGSSSQTNFTYQQWKTSSHGNSEAYIIAYGASHSSQAGNFAMKNLEANGEIFFELASSVEPLRFASNGAATFNKAFTFPTTDGSANQVLKTDGSGNVTWATEAAVSASTSISDADGDTKIQVEESADEDKIRFDTAGTERMIIDESGNVGIGTTSPQSFCRLDVRSTGASASAGIAAYGYASNGTAILGNGYAGSAAGTNYGIRGLSTGPRGSVSGSVNVGGHFEASGAVSNYALTTGAGNVGIGTDSPTTKLDVSGDFQVATSTSTNAAYIRNSGTGTALVVNQQSTGDILQIQDNSTPRLVVKDGGNVGIGTSSPEAKLHTVGHSRLDGAMLQKSNLSIASANISTDNEYISHNGPILTNGSTGNINQYGYFRGYQAVYGNDGTNGFNPYAQGAYSNPVFEFVSNNRGTISLPAGAAIRDGYLYQFVLGNSGSGGTNSGVELTSSNTTLLWGITSSNDAYFANNVGIGTDSPVSKLDVKIAEDTVANVLAGSYAASFTSTTSGNTGHATGILLSGSSGSNRGAAIVTEAQGAGNNHDLIFATSAGGSVPTERVRIDDTGRVGISTSTPNYLLDIESGSSALLRVHNTGSNVLTSLIAQNDLGTAKFSTQSGYSRIHSGSTLTYAANTTDSIFYSSGTEKMRLTSTGLTIGTATDTTTLEFPDKTGIPDSPTETNDKVQLIKMGQGGNGGMWQITGRGGMLISSADDSLVLANGDVGRFYDPNAGGHHPSVVNETLALLSDFDIRFTTGLQDGWSGGSSYTPSTSVFDSAGNLGIGTTSPSQKLDVVGLIRSGGIAHPEIELVPTGSVGNADIRFDGTSLDIRSNSSGAYLTLQTATTERLKITNTGNFEFNNGNFTEVGTVTASGIVNIGGGTSYYSEKLLVQGRTRVAGQLDIAAGTGYGNYAKFTHDDTELEIATVRSAGTNGQIVLSPLGTAALTLDTSQNAVFSGTISSGNITTTGYLAGPATFTIDPAAVGDNSGTVVIAGNLQVDGTTTTINSTTLTVDDLNITLASGSTNAAAANGAGITVDCGSDTDATLTYLSSGDQWKFNKELLVQDSNFPQLRLADADDSMEIGYAGENFFFKRNDNDGAIIFRRTDNSDVMAVNMSTMRVGIGTASPTYGLEVLNDQTSQSATGTMYVQASLNGSGRGLVIDSNTRTTADNSVAALQTITRANTTGLKVQVDGNVGIGTSSPSQKLQVAGTILADTALAASSGNTAIGIGSESNITDGNSTYKAKLITDNNNAKLTTYQYGSYLTLKAGVDGTGYSNNWSKIELRDGGGTGSNNAHMKFYTHGDERMVIDNYGNVGIGTNNPVDNYAAGITPESTKLAVVGANVSGYTEVAHFAAGTDSDNTGATVRIGHVGNDRGMFIKAGRGTSNQAKALLGVRNASNADSNILTLQEGGRVGIGTTSPNYTLDVVSTGGGINIGGTGAYLRWNSGDLQIKNEGSYKMGFYTYNSSDASLNRRMVIDTNGYVGIGTDSPAIELDIKRHTNAYPLRIGSSQGEGRAIAFADVNASPTKYNWIAGTQYNINNGFEITPSTAVGGYTFSNPALAILQTGNVGINQTSPAAKLQVEELGIDTTTTSTTATTQVAIDTFAAATFRSARYTIQVTNSTDSTYHLTEILLIHNGTTPQITEYGTIFTGSAEATFDADISSGNVRLLATPASTDSMTFKVVRHCITV